MLGMGRREAKEASAPQSDRRASAPLLPACAPYLTVSKSFPAPRPPRVRGNQPTARARLRLPSGIVLQYPITLLPKTPPSS